MHITTKPKDATSQDVMAAALAATPASDVDDTEVLAPTSADAQVPAEYEFDEEEGGASDDVVSNRGANGATNVSPPVASTAGATGEQPTAPAAAPVLPTTASVPASQESQTQTPPDQWAEAEDVTYTDHDTGDTYVVRAPKSYADKVRNGYARRSVMDRNSGYLSKHKSWLEPIITNKQLDDIAPIIQAGVEDRDFAAFVAQAYERRRLGLPLVAEQQQAIQQAQQQAPAPAATPNPTTMQALKDQIAARLSPDEVDDYTREAMLKSLEPVLEVLARQQDQQAQSETTARQQQEAQQRAERQRQANYDLGQRARSLLMETFPDDYNDRTPRDKFLEVMNYAQSSGMFERYGRAPSTFLLAAQALKSPMGLAGIGRAPAGSVAAQTIADIRRNGEAIASQAAQSVGAATATQTPGGSVESAKPKPQRVPRYIKDPRSPQGRRLLTPREIADYMAKHPGAV